jgi:TRAP transporter TAXI family solute receptor
MKINRVVFLGILSATIAVAALATYWYNRPTTLTFAVGPAGSEAARLIDALRVALVRERSSVRLRLVTSDTPSDSAAKIAREDVDLAIVRSDVSFPASAVALAIWQRNPVILAAPASSGIERWTDLSGRTLGVVGRGIGFNARLIETILREHGVRPETVKMIDVLPWETGDVFRNGLAHALVTIGPVATKPVADAMAGLIRETPDGRVKLVPIREAEAISERVPVLEAAEVVAGSFGSNPPRPAETYPTLAVLHYLVARRSISDAAAAELTQQLFMLRPTLATQHPSAFRIQVPETEKGSSVQVHPGALAYLTGEQKSFIELYSDYIYIAIFGLSLGGSALAALIGYLGWGRREPVPGHLPEVLHLLREARGSDDPDLLDQIGSRADDIFVESIESSKMRGFDSSLFSTLMLALDRLNATLADRRRALAMYEDHEDAPIEQAPLIAVSAAAAGRG